MPDVSVTSIRETWPISCEDITPRSWLLQTHSSIPPGSPLLRPKPRSWSLCRLLPAPAVGGPSRRYLVNPSQVPGPLSRRFPRSALDCFFLRVIGLPHECIRVGCPATTHEHDFSWREFSRLQVFLYVQASEFARLPGRSHRCAYCRRAAEALTSGQNVLRCLRTHRIY